MIRYMGIFGDEAFDNRVKHDLKDPVWCLDEKPDSKVPYIKLKIKIIGKEKRYGHERKFKPQTLLSCAKQALKYFKELRRRYAV